MEFAEIFGIFMLASTWVITVLSWSEIGRISKRVNKQNELFAEILNQCKLINGRRSEQESDSDA